MLEYFQNFMFYETLRSQYYEITGAIDKMFDGSSRMTDAQTAPLGLRECGLLPEQLRNYTVSTHSEVEKQKKNCGRWALPHSQRGSSQYPPK